MLFFLVIFSSFSIAITSLGEERAHLCTFRTFVRFALVWFCLFPLSLRVWDGLHDCGTRWTFLLPFLSSLHINFFPVDSLFKKEKPTNVV